MKRRARKTLFITFVILFLITGAYLTLIAQGFVIDFENFKIEKTGAIFLKFNPRDATLSINGEETDYAQKGILGLGGVIIKNLAPDSYELKISKEGFHDWNKRLEVQSGLITSESGVRLWPNTFQNQEVIEKNVQNFWLTDKGLVYENEKGQIVFEDTAIKGNEVFLTDKDSDALITKNGDEYFLIDLGSPRSAVNIAHLFNSLKQRQLGLPGSVPITDVFFHSFSPNKILVTSETSLYAIDTEKIEIEKLITLDRIGLVRTGTNEVFIVDNKENLTIINLLLKTSLGEPVAIGEITDLKIGPGGKNLYLLTPDGEIKSYERSLREINTLATEIESFEISSDGKRAMATKASGGLKILHLKEFEGDLKYEAGETFDIAVSGKIEKLMWLPDFPNYAAFIQSNTLIFQEIDRREPINSHPLFEGIIDYQIEGGELYLLKESRELIVSSIAEDA